MKDSSQFTVHSSQLERLNDGQIEELLRIYTLKVARPLGPKFTRYSRQVAEETTAALLELQKLRRGIRVEGTVE